ncbi:S8 family serine peptidase [Tahibacter sp.]|uniref:S8 family serine peptidase n=1 Tax=Tahibacter sp. TaxID=2056211 RepID=UPI0028C395A7|nr:S8 family serine peptidase [Tahibacter sp.]
MPAFLPARGVLRSAALLLALGLGAGPVAADDPDWAAGYDAAQMIVVAVANKPDPQPSAGATPRGYDALPNYAGGDRAVVTAANLSSDYHLREVSAWVIAPLRLRCMVFALPPSADRAAVIAQLKGDRRVRIAQPLQEFETFGDGAGGAGGPALPAAGAADAVYNDPYVGLQHNFSIIAAAGAQRTTRGDGVRIALIDAGVDTTHPDLDGRIAQQRDFVGTAPQNVAERHGTEVAGVIAAVANNKLGIVGIAPAAQLLAYRACWTLPAQPASARCNSYTLALALGAALASDAHIINLSLGGPADPLLEELLAYALARGTIVVGAVPPDRRLDGFPVGVPGVIAVASAEDVQAEGATAAAGVLRAPGRDILTLEPGGHYDYASGSSLATAHVTGALALLLALKPGESAAELAALLRRSQGEAGASIDICSAVAGLSGATTACGLRAAVPAATKGG